ncbi:glycine--tRNA ligase subunit beta [Thermodesulfovibrionales bacterium]|nr:glycine--tRNA ligase subunit beta [Thermodesulfovibrionales bacterium]
MQQTGDIGDNRYHTLLLEIGTEEIPARFLLDTINKLKKNAEGIFSEYRLSFSSIKTYATPRRLSLIAEIGSLQRGVEREIWGPPVSVAFDKKGRPTKAAEAFVKAHGISIDDLGKKDKGKGTYIVSNIKEEARQTIDVLAGLLPKLVLSLNFPKSMRWGDGNFRFVRPIHWILATYNNSKVAFEVGGIESSDKTRGHRFLSTASFRVRDCKTYIDFLRNNFVIVDHLERKRIILEGAKRLASSINASLMEDDALLEEVTFLVEYPVAVMGTFSKSYLSLPEELLITVMKDHQRYFALKDTRGEVTNHFIVIGNTRPSNAETIKKGAERVIRARLEDARFYYEEDRKVPLNERIEGLKRIIYHDKLGSLYDKCHRIARLSDFIADRRCPEKKGEMQIAAILSKADIGSGVVREFPELQGIMGSHYAQVEGYTAEVSKALAEQYLPAHSKGRLPESDIGTVLSLSDKLDNLASFFMIGLTPTGTEDPFALRRQAQGVVSILLERRYSIDIYTLLSRALQPLDADNRQGILDNLTEFLKQRVEHLFMLSGYSPDSISSILDFAKKEPLHITKERLDAIEESKGDANFESFLLAIKRVNNISPRDRVPPVNPELFVQEEEHILHRGVEAAALGIYELINEGRYYEAIMVLMTLKDPINTFFDKVFVMDKDEGIRQNRLSLIKDIHLLAKQIADFGGLITH